MRQNAAKTNQDGTRCPRVGDDSVKMETMSSNISNVNCKMRLKSARMQPGGGSRTRKALSQR